VVTNGDPAQQHAKLRASGLAGDFPVVIVSGEAGVAKPDAAIFHAACARLGLPPERVAYVGDRYDVDALGAAAAGLRGVWLNRAGLAAPASGPEALRAGPPSIRTLAEVPGVVFPQAEIGSTL
jgi:putative hydrolase of the HAD superfamily